MLHICECDGTHNSFGFVPSRDPISFAVRDALGKVVARKNQRVNSFDVQYIINDVLEELGIVVEEEGDE